MKINQAKSLKFTSTNIILKMSHEVSPFSGLLVTLDKSGLAAYWLFSFTTCYYLILKPGPIPCDSQLCRYHESFSIGVSPHLSKPSGFFTPLPFVSAKKKTTAWGVPGGDLVALPSLLNICRRCFLSKAVKLHGNGPSLPSPVRRRPYQRRSKPMAF